ncbi:hypothetical protein HK104_001597 [Borealophlyctis nickersoniae]|nr:hypothetical protein HK104_001597 [Borealophlyctis nickersoniae]
MPTETDSAEVLLAALADPQQCCKSLTARVRDFLSPAWTTDDATSNAQPKTVKSARTKLTGRVGATTARTKGGNDMGGRKELAVQLGNFAMKVMNQNAKTLTGLAGAALAAAKDCHGTKPTENAPAHGISGTKPTAERARKQSDESELEDAMAKLSLAANSEKRRGVNNATSATRVGTSGGTGTAKGSRKPAVRSGIKSSSIENGVSMTNGLKRGNTKTLAKTSAAEPATVHKAPPVLSILRCLAEVSTYALDALGALENDLPLERRRIEKAACNVAIKFVEAAAIVEIHARPHYRERPPYKKKTRIHFGIDEVVREQSNIRESLVGGSRTLQLSKDAKGLERVTMQPLGLYSTCLRLKSVEPNLAARACDAVYRMFYNASLKSTDEAAAVTLVDFYEGILDFVESRNEAAVSMDNKLVAWCDHCISTATKIQRLDTALRCIAHVRSIAESILMEAPDDPLACSRMSICGYTAAGLFLERSSDGSAFEKSCLEEAREAGQYLHKLRHAVSKAGENITADSDLFNLIRRNLNGLRILSRRVLELTSFNGKTTLVDILSTSLGEAVELFNNWETMTEVGQKSDVQNVVAIIIDSQTKLAQFSHTLGGDEAVEKAAHHLNTAARLSAKYRYAEGLCGTSGAYCNVGRVLYKDRQYGAALKFSKEACVLLGQLIKTLAATGSDKGGAISLNNLKLKLAHGYDLSAACHRELGNHEEALNVAEEALRTLPAVQYAALLKSTDAGLETPRDMCSGLMDRYIKLAVLRPGEYKTVYEIAATQLDDFPDVVSAVCEYELQILQGLHRRYDTVAPQTRIVDRLLESYDESKRPISRARALVEKAKLTRIFLRDSDDGDLELPAALCEQAIELLKSPAYDDDDHLALQCSNELAIAYSFWGICLNERNNYNAKAFRMALQIWKKLLRRVPIYSSKIDDSKTRLSDALASVGSVDRMFYYIEMLGDYFNVLNQPLNRILALRLLLRVITLRGVSDEMHCRAITIFADIGYAYIALGYTGQAGAALSQGKALLSTRRASQESSTYWQLCYCHYLSAIGNVEKSDSMFPKISPFIGNDATTSENPTKGSILVVSLAYFVRANLSLTRGTLAAAARAAETSFQLLGELSKGIMRRQKKQLPSEADSVEGTPDRRAQEGSSATLSEGLNAFTEWRVKLNEGLNAFMEWRVLQRLLESFVWLGQAYLLRGSIRPAEHYFRQGLELAEIVHSNIYKSDFLLCLAELDYRRNCLPESESKINAAFSEQSLVALDLAVREVAISKLRSGDQYVRNASYSDALQVYGEAEELLDEAMTEAVIAALEDKDLGFAHWQVAENWHANSPLELLPNCATSGWTLVKEGKVEEAERKLEAIADVQQRGLEQAEYCATLADLRFEKLNISLRGNSLFEIFGESAFSLPWCVPPYKSSKTTKQTKAAKASVALQKSIAQTEQLLEEAYRLSYTFGSAHLFHKTCHDFVLLNVMKAYLTTGTCDVQPDDLALSSAYYLDMAKALTAKREMLSALTAKVYPKASVNKRIEWPAPEEEEHGPAYSEDYLHRLYKLYSSEMDLSPAAFKSTIIDTLPSHWVVCSMSVDVDRQDMYVSRLSRGETPVVVRLPLMRQALREGEDTGLAYEHVFEELQNILEASKATTQKNAAGYVTKEDKARWWEERTELDKRLREVLQTVECAWLGGFKGLLSTDAYNHPDLEEALNEFKDSVEKLMLSTVGKKSSVRGRIRPLSLELCRTLLRLGAKPDDDRQVEDALYYLMDSYQFSGIGVDYDEINMDTMTFAFKDALEKFHDSFAFHSLTTAFAEEHSHIILIPDKNLQMFPWESIPVLRGRAVSRLPSYSFLRDRVLMMEAKGETTGLQVNAASAFYIVNPAGDLPNTQKEYERDFESEETWSGIIGRAPTETECEEALSNNDVFLYFGHGDGGKYIRGNRVRALNQCAVAILMGCSSGFLKPSGEFDPVGSALNYVMAGSPALVANLWDVTDRDIDRFSRAMMKDWGLLGSEKGVHKNRKPSNGNTFETGHKEHPTGRSLVEAVASARDTCNFTYLIGAAPVVYGVPVYLKHGK